MGVELSAIERRVFGVLMEKALSQPDYYPLTSSALVAGCNQKTARDPVMDLSEQAVLDALDAMRRRGLVGVVLPAPGARVYRYKHEAETVFGWNQRHRAVMAELLLRGPQTAGELRSHCTRMFAFESIESVMTVLESLAEGDAPAVAPMPREPGRPAVRYTHLLYPDQERPGTQVVATPSAAAHPSAADDAAGPAPDRSTNDAGGVAGELQSLRDELRQVREDLGHLSQRLGQLEERCQSGGSDET